MLKRNITYEDFDGNMITEIFYFNLTKTELVGLNVEHGKDGLEAWINKVIKAEDVKTVFDEFKKIVLLAYGIRSEDGKRFIKSEKLREEFSQTAAFDSLLMELVNTDSADNMTNFINAVMPRDMQEETARRNAVNAQMRPPMEDVQLPSIPRPPRPPEVR